MANIDLTAYTGSESLDALGLRVVVVSVYNEAQRLSEHAFDLLFASPDTHLLFVDDGSTDASAERLNAIAEHFRSKCEILTLPSNVGKAEAVRRGMLHALQKGAAVVGYLDADGAVPAGEMLRLLDTLEQKNLDVIIGARVALVGYNIRRNPIRHYLGRVFATMAALTLNLTIYDTQCGAKCFRATSTLATALARPFDAGWAFDVELLSRLLPRRNNKETSSPRPPNEAWEEMPLRQWEDKAGSKIGLLSPLNMFFSLIRLYIKRRIGLEKN